MTSPNSVILSESTLRVPLEQPPVCAVLFDWDQTLVHSNSFFRTLYLNVLSKEFGAEFANNFDFSKWRGRSVKAFEVVIYDEYMRRGYNHAEAEAKAQATYEQFIASGKELFPELVASGKIKLMDGAKETLTQLLDAGVPVGIVSNSPEEWLRDLLVPALLGEALSSRITTVGIRQQDEGKPHTDTVDRTLDEMRRRGADVPYPLDRKTVYFVGDSAAHDMEVAHRAGFTPVLFDRAGIEGMIALAEADKPIPPAMHATLYAENQSELQSLFGKLLRGGAAIAPSAQAQR